MRTIIYHARIHPHHHHRRCRRRDQFTCEDTHTYIILGDILGPRNMKQGNTFQNGLYFSLSYEILSLSFDTPEYNSFPFIVDIQIRLVAIQICMHIHESVEFSNV